MIERIKLWLGKWMSVALACLSVFGFGILYGMHIESQKIAEKQLEQAKETRKGDAYAVQKAAAVDRRIAAKHAQVDRAVDVVEAEIIRPGAASARGQDRPEPSIKGDEIQAPSNPAQLRLGRVCSDYLLSVRDVRLFNIAGLGAFDRATLPGDAEGQTPSVVTGDAFCQHYLAVVRQYHDLAIDHDELVEFVEGLQRDQRRRLGAE